MTVRLCPQSHWCNMHTIKISNLCLFGSNYM